MLQAASKTGKAGLSLIKVGSTLGPDPTPRPAEGPLETAHASSCLMEEGVELCRAVWQHNQGTLPGSGPARTSGQVSRLLVQCSLWEGEGAMQMLGFGTRQGGPGLSCGLAKRSVDGAFMHLYLLSQSLVYP